MGQRPSIFNSTLRALVMILKGSLAYGFYWLAIVRVKMILLIFDPHLSYKLMLLLVMVL